MSVVLSNAAPQSPDDGVIFDYWYGINWATSQGGAPSAHSWLAAKGALGADSYLPTGTALPGVFTLRDGLKVMACTSGAGIQSAAWNNVNSVGPFGVPLGRRNIATGRMFYPICEYLFEVALRVGAARGNAQVALGFLNGSVQAGQAGIGTFFWSDTATAGGAWHPRTKRTQGIADFFLGNPTSIVLDNTWRKMGLRYIDDPAAPRMEFEIDDATVAVIVGGDLPQEVTGVATIFTPTLQFSNVVGTTVDCADAHWQVRQR